MMPYVQGFLDTCGELGVDACALLKIAEPLREYLFDVSSDDYSGNSVGTRSKAEDYNRVAVSRDYKGNVHYPSDFREIPEVQRLHQADGSVKYRVYRRLLTPNQDRVGRKILESFSVVVDSPYKAMRLAKGNVAFDPDTKRLLDSVERSIDGRLANRSLKQFGLHVTKPGIASGLSRVKRTDVQEQAPSMYRLLKRLARLHPGKAKLAVGGALSVPAVGSALYALLNRKRKKQ